MTKSQKVKLLLIGSTTPQVRQELDQYFAVHQGADVRDWDQFLAEVGDAIQAVATNGHDGLPPKLMAALPNLKIISCYGVGYDAIDAQAAAERGIMVTHTPDVLNKDVANTAIMLLLAVSRCLLRDDAYVRSGKWPTHGEAPLTRSIEGANIGLLGLGRIGQTIAHKLQIFEPEIFYHTRHERQDVPYRYCPDLVEMAQLVDALIVITPGGAETRKLVNRNVINALGPEGLLINVARGTVIDEAELVAALCDGRLGGAGLDVFENEPHVPPELVSLDTVVLLPHIGSATVETRRAMGNLTVKNLVRFFAEGKALTPVPECAELQTQS